MGFSLTMEKGSPGTNLPKGTGRFELNLMDILFLSFSRPPLSPLPSPLLHLFPPPPNFSPFSSVVLSCFSRALTWLVALGFNGSVAWGNGWVGNGMDGLGMERLWGGECGWIGGRVLVAGRIEKHTVIPG